MTPRETNFNLAEKQGLDPGPRAIGQCCILHGLPQVDLELGDERVSSLFFCPLENAGVAGSLRS